MLRYVYGVAAAAAAPAVAAADLRGIERSPVRAIVEGPLAAVVSDVDDAVYASAPLNERIADLDWLAERAESHQKVNAEVLEIAGGVIPLAFGALYRDDDRVREMLCEDVQRRATRLRELAGRGEWLVTVVRDQDAAAGADAELRTIDDEIARSTPGRAFLLDKHRTTVAARAAERTDAQIALDALARIEPVAERTYREPVARSGDDVVVLRLSLLAPRDAADRLDAAVRDTAADLERRGYRLRVTGPWPAYRFGSLP